MSYYLRRFLLFLIVLIFFIAAPLVVYYAKGYRFDFRNLEFVKTGTISIKTIPRNAAVYLDGELLENGSPLKIDGLKPRQYTLKISKEGYEPWEAQLAVKPEMVTAVTHVILLPVERSEKTLLQEKIQNFALSPDKEKIIYSILEGEKKGVYLYDLKASQQSQISTIYFDEFLWSPDGRKVILKSDSAPAKRFAYLDTTEIPPAANHYKLWDLGSLLPDPLEKASWQPGNSQRVFLLCTNDLYEVDLENQKINLIEKGVQSFSLTTWGVFYVQKQRYGYFLFSEDYRLARSKKMITRMPEADNYKIFPGSKKIACLVGDQLYLILNQLLVPIGTNAQDASWSPDGKRLLYYNDHQINVYHLPEKKNVFLTRDSRAISNIGWWPRSQYIIYSVEGKIKLLDGAREMDSHAISEIKNTQLPNTRIDWSENTKDLFCLAQDSTTNKIIKINLIWE